MKSKNNHILLLQSGGRDSAVGAATLLSSGNKVFAITFLNGRNESIDLPLKRAYEISQRFRNYSWAAIDYYDWQMKIKDELLGSGIFEQIVPKSCLICAIARLTASIQICRALGIDKIAVGYTQYQSEWAEQTSHAIERQKEQLNKFGIQLLTPVSHLASKSDSERYLKLNGLVHLSLENPCCVSAHGTQPVSQELTTSLIEKGFKFRENNTPELTIVKTIGNTTLCL